MIRFHLRVCLPDEEKKKYKHSSITGDNWVEFDFDSVESLYEFCNRYKYLSYRFDIYDSNNPDKLIRDNYCGNEWLIPKNLNKLPNTYIDTDYVKYYNDHQDQYNHTVLKEEYNNGSV